MTLKVFGAIHFEAARLWAKGVPIVPRHTSPAYSFTIVDRPVTEMLPCMTTLCPSQGAGGTDASRSTRLAAHCRERLLGAADRLLAAARHRPPPADAAVGRDRRRRRIRTAAIEAQIDTAESYGALWKLARRGALGFAESYMDGDIDTDDLRAAVRVLSRQRAGDHARACRASTTTRRRDRRFHRRRRNTRAGSRRNIADHYDLGNAFYRLWLDPEHAVFERHLRRRRR